MSVLADKHDIESISGYSKGILGYSKGIPRVFQGYSMSIYECPSS